MPAETVCAKCGRKLKVRDETLGKTVRCPACKGVFVAVAAPAPEEEILDVLPADDPPPPERDAITARPRPAPQPAPRPVPRRRPEPITSVTDAPADDFAPLAFKAAVKEDPRKALKGVLQASVGPEGLRLRQGKKVDLLVPRGAPAEYLDENKLAVEAEGRTLTLAVNKFGSYQARIARDVADFLAGERRGLDPASYRLEWYLYVPAALPFGIPVLTVGGAIWGALGFGLAAGCFAIAQVEKLPKAARLGITLGLNVLAYGAVLFLWSLQLSQGGFAKLNAPVAPPPAEFKRIDPVIAKGPADAARMKEEMTKKAEDPVPRFPAAVEQRKDEAPGGKGEPAGRSLAVTGEDGHVAQFLPDDNALVTWGGNKAIRFWDPATGRELRFFLQGHVAGLSPDGRQVYFRDGPVLRRRVLAEGRELPGSFEGELFAVSPDGKRLVTWQEQARKLRSYNLTTGELEASWDPGRGPAVIGLALAPDGTEVALAPFGQAVEVRDVATGAVRARCHGGRSIGGESRPVYAPDGKTLAAAHGMADFTLYDAATGDALHTFGEPPPWRMVVLAFSADGKKLAGGTAKGLVRVWDLGTGKPLTELRIDKESGQPRADDSIHSLSFSRDGRHLAASNKRAVRVWDVADLLGGPTVAVPTPQTAPLAKADAPAGADGAAKGGAAASPARVIDPPDGDPNPPFMPGRGPGVATVGRRGADGSVVIQLPPGYHASSVALSPDGKTLALGVDPGASLWDVAGRREVALLRPPRYGSTGHVAFSSDGKTLVCNCGRKVQLWGLQGLRHLRTLDAPSMPIQCLGFSPDGRTVAAGVVGVRLWDVETGTARTPAPAGHLMTSAVAYSPDGKRLAGGDVGRTIRVWDTDDLENIATLSDRTEIRALAFSPDGRTLAAGGNDRGVRLWDVATKQARELTRELEQVAALVFTADGKRLLVLASDRAGIGDGQLRIWDVAAGRELGRMGGSGSTQFAISFSADRRSAASIGKDKTLRLWDLTRLPKAAPAR